MTKTLKWSMRHMFQNKQNLFTLTNCWHKSPHIYMMPGIMREQNNKQVNIRPSNVITRCIQVENG